MPGTRSRPGSPGSGAPPLQPAKASPLAAALEALNAIRPPAQPTQPPKPPQPFTACSGPDERTAPSFDVLFRRPVTFSEVDVPAAPDGHYALNPDTNTACVLAGAKVKLPSGSNAGFRRFDLAIDLRFLQTWNLLGLGIGDLASTMA